MTHYFSKIRVKPGPARHELFREALKRGTAYQDHAFIWRLFPGDGHQRDFLFRRLRDPWAFLVVSERMPCSFDPVVEVETKRYEPSLEEGAMVRFDLRANPVVSRRSATGSSRRHDVLMDAKRRGKENGDDDVGTLLLQAGRDWVLSRCEQWGLQVDPGSLIQSGHFQHRLRPRKRQQEAYAPKQVGGREAREKEREILFSSLDYQGVARVQDSRLLRKALLAGVGHAKGFGCGLLLVRYL